MKRITLIIIAILVYSLTNAQEQDVNSHYIFDNYYINPAAAGSKNHQPFSLTVKQRWVGFNNPMANMSFQTHRPITGRMSVGAQLFDKYENNSHDIGLGGSYAYSIPVIPNKAKISLGTSVKLRQFSLLTSQFNVEDNDDPLIGEDYNKIIFDASFGAYFETKELYAGIVLPSIATYGFEYQGNIVEKLSFNNIYLHGGYRYNITPVHKLEPSLLAKVNLNGEIDVDVNLLFALYNRFLFGVSFKSSEAVSGLIGVDLDFMYFAYMYDYGILNAATNTQGSHEIMAAFKLWPKRRTRLDLKDWEFRAQ